MDLQCRVAAEGGHCYLDHLPLLGRTLLLWNIYCVALCMCTGSEYQTNPTPFICAGDIALLEMDLDLLKGCHETLSIWDEDIAEVCRVFFNNFESVFVCSCSSWVWWELSIMLILVWM